MDTANIFGSFLDSYFWSNFLLILPLFHFLLYLKLYYVLLSFINFIRKMQTLDVCKMLWRFQCMCYNISECLQVCKDFGHLLVGFEHLIRVCFSLHIIDLVLGELVESRDSFWKLLNLMVWKVHFKTRNNHNK